MKKQAGINGRRDALKKIGGIGLMSIGTPILSACGGSNSNPTQSLPANYRVLFVDASNSIGQIKSLQGVNAPPVPALLNVTNMPSGATHAPGTYVFDPDGLDYSSAYKQMNVSMVRTRDSDAKGSMDVDGLGVNRIFPDWSADPANPASYNFTAADAIVAGLVRDGITVFFALGRSDLSMIGLMNDPTPPDPNKYAAVVKQIVLHYNHGWANGFQYGIKYWEIWNEPDVGAASWTTGAQAYYAFYATVTAAIKSVDPSLKVGGPALAINNDSTGYRESLLQYLKANDLPLDFFSFHWYSMLGDPYDFPLLIQEYRSLLDGYGFPSAEIHLNEWGHSLLVSPPPSAELVSAFNTCAMTYMQDSALDYACNYQRLFPLINDDGTLTKVGSAFACMGNLSGMARLTTSGGDNNGLTVLAGSTSDQKEIHVLVSNYEIQAIPLAKALVSNGDLVIPGFASITLPEQRTVSYTNNAGYALSVRLPGSGSAFSVARYRIDASNQMTLLGTQQGQGQSVAVSASLPPPAVEYIVIRLS